MIQINVSSANAEDVTFKIKKTTKFEKLFKTYKQKYNLVDQNNVRFVYNGETINND